MLSNPSYTIGCSVEVRLHDYNKVTSSPTYFIEFWDVGGTFGHEKGRSIFYNSINGDLCCFVNYWIIMSVLCAGIIAVHDLTNRKSHTNLRKWLSEALCHSMSLYYAICIYIYICQ